MQDMAQIFKALSEETRLRIMGLLLEGELCVCDLMAILELPQSTVSRHLSYLRNAKLISGRREGVWMHYRVVDGGDHLGTELAEMLRNNLISFPRAGEDHRRLKQYLENGKKKLC